jgi:glucosamine-6-phosphate deaminase
MQEFKVDQLDVRIFETRAEMGRKAALAAGDQIKLLLNRQEFVNIIFAAAPSQDEFLSALSKRTDITWQKVNAFHMDEYVGLADNAPQRFGAFLKERIFGRLPFHSVNYIDGNANDPMAECTRYASRLAKFPADMVCMGIGENGHIAFNDPPVADFADPLMVKVVELDAECRQQQVNDGCFHRLEQVPTHALTLTVPALMAGRYIYCIAPGKSKAKAVDRTLKGEISERCPASILRKHPNALLFLDKESSLTLSLDNKKTN